MHYQLLKRVMRTNGLGVLLDDPGHGNHVREVLRSSVLFTDMGVHNDFMTQFKKLIDGEAGTLCQRQTIVCQAILKNADISNPVCSLIDLLGFVPYNLHMLSVGHSLFLRIGPKHLCKNGQRKRILNKNTT
jgi:hypothetical protein